jgi:hypothetical protein
MQIFKRSNRERGSDQKVTLRFFKRQFGKNGKAPQDATSAASGDDVDLHSGNGPSTPSVDSASDPTADTASENQDGSSVSQTLWDRAYDSLKRENWKLVEEYENLLSIQLSDSSTSYLHASCCSY